ncbi:FAD-binding protein [Maribacter algarum]|uniref:FAD-binding protein n=1 Tax=Maribacter algarum (ex Zhang et al. 2020) TaxID=2578118 RepID=A0A5S3PQ59_9FLAO|nr:FAD-dependent oxidoreductase [Maribacter algarum]TMM56876.1 FAD-binding protein [Maribacter algarum]
MSEISSKYIIVGAGLSGLTTAYQLEKTGETDFIILESRNRIGGRIHTCDGIDLGATWFQPHHQNVSNLLDELELSRFHQFSKGRSVLVYSTMAPEHYFESDSNTPSAFRIAGSSSKLIQKLAAPFSNRIYLETAVSEISERGDALSLQTNKGIFIAEKVIVTVPPKIATRITFTPELSEVVMRAMDGTHTWMSNAMKVGMTFKRPFWRNKNLSGTVIGQVGAVTELYDHSNFEDNTFALMGFVNEGLRDYSSEERKERILDYLTKYLGKEIGDYLSYEEKDWSQDWNTSCETIKSVYMSPAYGNPIFTKAYMKGRLLFSGAETSPLYGGYMDGAIYSGILAAQKVCE